MIPQPADAAQQTVATAASGNVIVVGILTLFSNIGISSWAEFAGLLACILTLTHLGILWWKIMWKPLFVRLGWLQRDRRKGD